MIDVPSSEPRDHVALPDGLALVIVAVLMTIVLSASWNRWLDPILDSGRDLYIPEQITHGSVLYRDFQYQFPPVAPYVLAAGTLLVGSDLPGYVGMGCFVGAVVALALYFLLLAEAGRAAALAGASLFVTLSLTAATNWGSNFVLPYAHAATIGMMFVVLYLLLMSRYLFHGRSESVFWLALLMAVFAAGSKMEYALTVGASLLGVLLLNKVHRRMAVAIFLLPTLVFTLLAVIFGGGPRAHHWLRGNILLLMEQKRRSIAFYDAVRGTDHLAANILKSLLGAVIVLTIVALLAALQRMATSRVRGKRIFLVALSIALLGVSAYGSDYIFFRAWSLLQLALIPFALRRAQSPLPFFLIASWFCSSRILLNLTPAWYGFALMVPTYVLILYTLFEFLPAEGFYSRRLGLLWLPILALLMIRAQLYQRDIWSHCIYPVETARGVYFDWNHDRAQVIQEFLDTSTNPKSLVVIPESPTLNYFTKAPNPLWHQMFTPHFADDDAVESEIISEFANKRPELLALVARPLSEFGYRGFGIDYDLRLAGYIQKNYRVRREWRRPGFSLLLAERVSP